MGGRFIQAVCLLALPPFSIPIPAVECVHLSFLWCSFFPGFPFSLFFFSPQLAHSIHTHPHTHPSSPSSPPSLLLLPPTRTNTLDSSTPVHPLHSFSSSHPSILLFHPNSIISLEYPSSVSISLPLFDIFTSALFLNDFICLSPNTSHIRISP